jgi:hypothetical protein
MTMEGSLRPFGVGASGLLIVSFRSKLAADPGFKSENVFRGLIRLRLLRARTRDTQIPSTRPNVLSADMKSSKRPSFTFIACGAH